MARPRSGVGSVAKSLSAGLLEEPERLVFSSISRASNGSLADIPLVGLEQVPGTGCPWGSSTCDCWQARL